MSPGRFTVDELEKELHEFLTESPSERLEMRVRRLVEWRIWWKKVLGRTFPIREKSYRLQWPDVPEAEKERRDDSGAVHPDLGGASGTVG